MAGKVADTIFGGYGTDEVLAVDAYGIRDSVNKNSVFDAARDTANDASATIRKQIGAVSEVAALARTKTFNEVSELDIRNKMHGLLNGANSFSKFSNNAQQKIFGALKGSADRAVGLAKTVIGDKVSIVDYACTSATGGIMDLLRDLTGNGLLARIFDFNLESTFFSAILDDAMVCGVDVFDLIKSQSSDPYVWQEALAKSSPKAMQIGRFENIARIVDEIGSDRVLGEAPDSVKRMLANYRLDPRTTPDQYGDKSAELKGLLVTLDPHWDSTQVGNRHVINLDIFRNASEDVKTVLKEDPVYRTAIMTAPHYVPQSMPNMAQSMYPYAPLTSVA